MVGGSADPWMLSDPWAQAGKTINKKEDMKAEEDTSHTAFEDNEVITKFISSEKKQLRQIRRQDYQVGMCALVLCGQPSISAFVSSLDPDAQVMVLTDKLSKAQQESLGAQRTQVVVKTKVGERVMSLFAIIAGPANITAVQDAWTLELVDSESVMATLKVRQDLADDTNYQLALKKETLATFLGKFAKVIHIGHRKFEEDPPAVRWQLEIPRVHLLEVLALSGNHEAIIYTSREEEEKLKGHTVFVQSLSIAKVYEQLQGIGHWGLAGPTRSGALIVRTPGAVLEQVRKAVLAPTSPFADVLGMPVNVRFKSGRVSRGTL